MNFFKEIQQPVNESRLGIQPDQNLAEDWDSIPDQYKNDVEAFKELWPNEKAQLLAKAYIIKTDGHSYVITKGEKWDNFWKRNEPIDIKTPYAEVDFDAIYKKAKHDYAVLHSDREDELAMGSAGRRELQQRAEELAEMKRVTLRNERLHDEEVAFQRAETIQQRKDEMKKIADKYNHELAVINAEHSNNMQAIRTGNNHEINKMNMEYKHEKEMWDKNNPQEKPDDEEEYVKPQQSGNNFDQDTGEPIKPAGSQQSNQWHTSQQLTSPTKPTKPGKDDDVTDVEPKPNKPLTLGNNMKKESATARPLPQKPLMAVSMDRWKQAVLNRYPKARFATQKMINGATFATDMSGQVGIYDPKNSYAKVGPESLKTESKTKASQGVGEAGKPDAYQRDEINATSGFGKNSYAYQMDGGANDEDHEGDRRREQQVQSGTWYIRLNGKLIKDKTGKPYSFSGKAAANKAALTMQAKLFNQGKEFMLTTNPNDKVAEGTLHENDSPVAGAITRRIMLQRSDLLSKYGPVKVMAAIDDVADFVGDTEEIGSSDVSGWIKQVEQSLAGMGESLKEELQADDGDYYESADDFFGQFEAESFDNEETSPDKMEIRGYIDGVNVMVWRYDDESMTGGYGYHDDSAMQEGVAEASLAQMRDYFNKPDGSTQITRAPGSVGKPNANVPQEIQILINKMYHSGKVTPEEFKILQDFQRKTKINVGIKEATTGNAGYDSMLAVMKAADAGQDATFDLGGEPITLDYNEARFLAGRYKAFLKAGRQEEFLKYMENPMAFDHLMKQLRDLMDKQKNFKGSVQGERGIEEGSQQVDSLVTDALKIMRGSELNDAVQALKTVLGDREYNDRRGHYNFYVRQLIDMYRQQGMAESIKSLPPVNENEYWCKIDSAAKPIPEGYKKLASGYITKVS